MSQYRHQISVLCGEGPKHTRKHNAMRQFAELKFNTESNVQHDPPTDFKKQRYIIPLTCLIIPSFSYSIRIYTKGENPKVNRHSIAKGRPFGTWNTSKHSLLTRRSDMNLEQLSEPQKCFWGYVEPLNLWKINGHLLILVREYVGNYFCLFWDFFFWIKIKIIPPKKYPSKIWFLGARWCTKKIPENYPIGPYRSAWDLGDWRTWQHWNQMEVFKEFGPPSCLVNLFTWKYQAVFCL